MNKLSIQTSSKEATNEGGWLLRFGVRAGSFMCDQCVELDKKIERYRRLSSSLFDQITIDRIKTLIDELQIQKIELHPEQKP